MYMTTKNPPGRLCCFPGEFYWNICEQMFHVKHFAGSWRAAGPAAEPPTRAEPVCFGEAETACGPDPYLAEDGRGGPGKAETDPRKGRTPK